MNNVKKIKSGKSTTAFSIASAAAIASLLQSETTAQTNIAFKSVENLNYQLIDGNIVIQTPTGPLTFDSSQYFIESGKVFLSENSLAAVELGFGINRRSSHNCSSYNRSRRDKWHCYSGRTCINRRRCCLGGCRR